MPEGLQDFLLQPGIVWVVVAAFFGGLVRGFSGFGTALVFLPIAGSVLGPFAAITALISMDIIGPLPVIGKAWRASDKKELGLIVLGMVLVTPFGLWTLTQVDPSIFRIAVSFVTLGIVVFMLLNLRYRSAMGTKRLLGLGGVSGFAGGFAGLPGPPVVLCYMCGPYPAERVRAHMMVYLTVTDLVLLLGMAAMSRLMVEPLILGLLLVIPNALGNMLGARMFDPSRQKMYRAAAIVIITASALIGLPVWG